MDASHAAPDELPDQPRRRAPIQTSGTTGRRKLPAVCEISRPETTRVWLQGDLNLQAKLLMLLRLVQAPKKTPAINWIAGVFYQFGCGDRI